MTERAWYWLGVALSVIGLLWFADQSYRAWYVNHWLQGTEGTAWRSKVCATITKCTAIEAMQGYQAGEGFVTTFKVRGTGAEPNIQIDRTIKEEVTALQVWRMHYFVGKINVDVSNYRPVGVVRK